MTTFDIDIIVKEGGKQVTKTFTDIEEIKVGDHYVFWAGYKGQCVEFWGQHIKRANFNPEDIIEMNIKTNLNKEEGED